MNADDPRHGTQAGYRAPCRCHPCRRANTRYSKARRLRMMEGDALTVPALGSQRRIEALQFMAWSLQDIADAMGWQSEQATHRILQRKRLKPETAQRISATFDRLCMTMGPSPSARRWAKRNGIPGPLAWDDIDNPDEQPQGLDAGADLPDDEAVVERILAGDWRIKATRDQRLAVIARWTAGGGSQNALERLTGWNVTRDLRRRANEAARRGRGAAA